MTTALTFTDVIGNASEGEIAKTAKTRKIAAAFYAPRKRNIIPKRIYQVTVNGKPETGKGFSTVAWRLKKDAELCASRKRNYLHAVWGNEAPKVKVIATIEPVATLQEYIKGTDRRYREYRRKGEAYAYAGFSE